MSEKPLAMRDALLESVYKAMKNDSKVFFVCADFGSPVLDKIRADFPHRYINVGIAEQNLINVSCGLALEGFAVFAYAIAPFITMRCFEQIRINLALLSEVREVNVNLIGVGAGCSYVVSGPTHQCYEDLTIIRSLPNVELISPADHITASSQVAHCIASKHPKYIRLDAQLLPSVYKDDPDLITGFSELASGNKVCLLATGYMVHTAMKVVDILSIEGISTGLIDFFNLSRFDGGYLADILGGYSQLVTLEEGFCGRGGLDSLLFNFIAETGLELPLLNIGIENSFSFELGSREDLHRRFGIGPVEVAEKVKGVLSRRKNEVSTDA